MDNLQDVVSIARPPPTPQQIWLARQKRAFATLLGVGLALFLAGLVWLARGQNQGIGVAAVLVGLALALGSAFFGIRAMAGREER